MKIVTFVKNYSPYVKGDIAGIDNKLATHVVDEGYAVAYKKSKVEPKKDAKAEEKEVKPEADKMVDNADKKGKVVTK